MAERRSRRPASSRRPRVAGLRNRTTRGSDSEQQEPPVPEETLDALSREETEPADVAEPAEAAEESRDAEPAGDAEESEGPAGDAEESRDAEPAGDAEPAEDTENTGADDPANVGVFGGPDDPDPATRSLVVRDGVVGFGEAVDEAGDGETGTAEDGEPGDEEPASDAGSDESGTSNGRADAKPSRRRPALVAVLGVLTVVCLGLAYWFQTNVRTLREEGPASNEALIDRGATSEVNGEVSDAVTRLFSYDFADTAKTERAADQLLVGGAVKEYEQLFSTVKQQAPKQKLVVTTTVQNSGVTYLQEDRARVLLFVDQNASRNGEKGKVVPAQLSVGVEQRGDQWKINQIIQR